MMKQFLLGLLATTALCASLRAEGTQLGLGDSSPSLDHVTWIQGEPVAAFEKGHVYVLDFWATWCGPCVASIPHINALAQERADDVSVIGVAIWPREGMTPTDQYVAEKGDAMSYRIAADIDGQTADAFMRAAGQNGIPTCMVIDQLGRIAWIGHPMAGLDDVVAQVVDGTWDLEAAKVEAAKVEAAKVEEERRQAELQEKAMPLFMALRKADQDADYDKAADLALQLAELDEMFSNFAVNRYVFMRKGGHPKEARAYAEGLVAETHHDNVPFLNMFAWSIASPDNEDTEPDLPLALRAAKRAAELTESKDADVLDTLARVHFGLGQLADAIAIQEKAVAVAPEAMQEPLRKTLESYRNPAVDEGEGDDDLEEG